MMQLLHQSHQVHFFTDNADVPATPHTMTLMLKELGAFNLMPTFGNMINALNGEKKQFLNMVNSDQGLSIEFPPDRIVINSDGSQLDSFITNVQSYLEALANIYPEKKGNRISIVSNKIYSGTEDEYNSLYRELFTYRSITPFEWDNRIAEKKQLSNNEKINCISTIRRGMVGSPRIDGGRLKDLISCEIDINTVAENAQIRISLHNAKEEFIHLLNEEVNNTSSLLDRYFSS